MQIGALFLPLTLRRGRIAGAEGSADAGQVALLAKAHKG